jgi:phospholipase/carboxylesterase
MPAAESNSDEGAGRPGEQDNHDNQDGKVKGRAKGHLLLLSLPSLSSLSSFPPLLDNEGMGSGHQPSGSTVLAGFIHRIVKPGDIPGEIFLLLHGTGGDENDLVPLGQVLAGRRTDVALLAPRGQVLERGMPRFFRRLAEGVFDEADLIRRTQDLAGFIEQAAKQYGFTETPITAIGFSNGANIGASLLLLRPEVLNRAVLFHAMVPLVPTELPDLHGKSVFLGAGRLDPLIPTGNTEQLAELLRQAGAEVELFWHDGGHQLAEEEVRRARDWLAA